MNRYRVVPFTWQKTGEKCCIVFEVSMVVTLRNRELGEE